MPHVQFVVPNLDYAGHSKQVALLAPALAARGWTIDVESFGGDGPFRSKLDATGIAVSGPLCRIVKNPRTTSATHGIVHVFGLRALRRLTLANIGRALPPIYVSLSGHERPSWLDRQILRRVARVIVPHASAADLIRRSGVRRPVEIVPLAVGPAPAKLDRAATLRQLGLDPELRYAFTAGRMDTPQSLYDCVWAFEFLRYADPQSRLLVVGDGPFRPRLEGFANTLAPEGSHSIFLGARPDASSLVQIADAALVLDRTGGANVALEAMAAGRPVVAANTPDLAAVVRPGTGIFVAQGDRPGAARELRRFLNDPELAAKFGAAAAESLADHRVETVAQLLESVFLRG